MLDSEEFSKFNIQRKYCMKLCKMYRDSIELILCTLKLQKREARVNDHFLDGTYNELPLYFKTLMEWNNE